MVEKMVGIFWGRNYGLVTGGQGGIGRAQTDLRYIKYVMASTTHWQINIARTPEILTTRFSCLPPTLSWPYLRSSSPCVRSPIGIPHSGGS